MNAVITADIIDYSSLSTEQENLVLNVLHETFKLAGELRTNLDGAFRIRRGDNIQIELDWPQKALRSALLLKAAINKLPLNNGKKTRPGVDIRIAIGIGEILGKRSEVDESTGVAYSLSGRTLDSMKKHKRAIAIKTMDEAINAELDTEFKLLEVIMSGWTIHSAEVIYWIMLGLNEKEISNKLNISQSAINQRKKTAGWNGIEPLIRRFEELIPGEALK
jgi:hypothetical protein